MKRIVSTVIAAAIVGAPVMAQTPVEPLRPLVPQTVAPSGRAMLPANTEVVLSMNDDLTTKGGAVEVGTMFGLTVAYDVKLGEYVIIPKGSRGVGEVTWKTGKGAFGKSGKMEIELRYVEVGGQRIPIEGKYRQEGEGNTTATVGAVIAAGVLGGFVTGKSAKIPRGRELVAHTRDAIPVALPASASIPAPAAPPIAALAPASK